MTTMPLDTSFLLREATQGDAVQRKLDMNALQERLSDPRTKQEKLRESCEGFEAIFVQKMWEQMRKTVPKEGYLHSKDEETYQSLFDIELSKKMTSAGGIGLADMLYEQLSQQLEHTSRTTSPGAYRQPLEVPTRNAANLPSLDEEADKNGIELSEADLYSPLEEDQEETANGHLADAIALALADIRENLDNIPPSSNGAAIRAEIAHRSYAGEIPEQALQPSPGSIENIPAAQAASEGFGGTTWQNNGQVSAAPKPVSSFARTLPAESAAESSTVRRGMVPPETVWPYDGQVVSEFGWSADPSGRRVWNSGVTMSGSPGDPVQAILDGTVVFSGERDGHGNTIILEHQGGLRSYYGNVIAEDLDVGDGVFGGSNFAQIAENSSSGLAGEKSAPFHFELKKGEMALNPEAAIRRATLAGR